MSQSPSAEKKLSLKEFFCEALRAQTYAGEARYDAALEKARANGISDADIEWFNDTVSDPDRFWKEFGEDAIPEDLQAVLYMFDGLVMPGWPKRYSGLYPKLNK